MELAGIFQIEEKGSTLGIRVTVDGRSQVVPLANARRLYRAFGRMLDALDICERVDAADTTETTPPNRETT